MKGIRTSAKLVKHISEGEAQKAVCEYLRLNQKRKGYMFWRSNNLSVYDVANKRFRAMPAYSLKGLPDIIVIWNGQFIGLEVKTRIGKQSDGQKEFERMCRDAGGEYVVVRGIDDVIEIGL